MVVQKALRRIDKTDGGLSRKRWEAMESGIGRTGQNRTRRMTGTISRVPGDTGNPTRSCISRLPADGVQEEPGDGEDNFCVVPLDSAIYVSIHDPLGLPTFRPSPAKPIPQWMQPPWMQMLPSQHQPSRAVEPRPRSILNQHFSDVCSASEPHVRFAEPDIVRPNTPNRASEQLLSPGWCRRGTGPNSGQQITIPEHDTVGTNAHRGLNLSLVTSPPLVRPSSRLNQPCSRLNSPNLVVKDLLSRSKSPYLIPPRRYNHNSPISSACDTNSYTPSAQSSDRSVPCSREALPLAGAPGSAPLNSKNRAHRTPPPQSKEYLDLYNPKQSGSKPQSGTAVAGRSRTSRKVSASIAVAGRRGGRFIGNWDRSQVQAGAVTDQRRGLKQNEHQDGSKDNEQEVKGGNEAHSNHGGWLKREGLYVELRKLFGREP